MKVDICDKSALVVSKPTILGLIQLHSNKYEYSDLTNAGLESLFRFKYNDLYLMIDAKTYVSPHTVNDALFSIDCRNVAMEYKMRLQLVLTLQYED